MAGVRREQVEDAELGRGEPDGSSAPHHLVRLRIEVQALDLDARLGLLAVSLAGASENGADAHGELAELEGLEQEIVRPQIEAANEVLRVAAAGEHEDGGLLLFLADLAEHLEPIETRQP